MQSTRKKILDYMDSNHAGSALEISRALGVTPANIRHHLNVLHQTGLVKIAGHAERGGRGRPTIIYMATPRAQKNNLATLAAVLLKELTGSRKKALDKRLANLAKLLGCEVERSGSIVQRLYATTRHLNSMHYNSHWEAHAGGPQIMFRQCPYAAIIDGHPELCIMDTLLLEMMLDMDIQQTAKIETHPDGVAQCVFRMIERPKPKI